MPTYQYRCETCGADFEYRQSFSDDPLKKCPRSDGPPACASPGKGKVAKVFSAPGITFKGSGFYKTDSRSSSGSSSGSSGSSGSSDSTAGSSSESSTDSSSSGSSSESSTATPAGSASSD